jgi:hypothetical protein
MPQWLHDRAHHIMSKNPDVKKSTAFAIATQQSHATGHTPPGYGTAEGKRKAKKKYDEPQSEYTQTADPSHKSKSSSIDLASLKGFSDELEKIALLPMSSPGTVASTTKSALRMPTMTQKGHFAKPNPSMPTQMPSAQNTLPPPLATATGHGF